MHCQLSPPFPTHMHVGIQRTFVVKESFLISLLDTHMSTRLARNLSTCVLVCALLCAHHLAPLKRMSDSPIEHIDQILLK